MGKGVNFYFLRHGQTYLNRYERIQGWSDSPLTESGINDAIRSGKALKNIQFESVYSSDLLRAVQTAEYFISENEQGSSHEIITMMELREQFFGSFEGQSYNWDQVYGMADFLLKKNDFKNQSPIKVQMDIFKAIDPYGDAENFNKFWERVSRGIQKIVTEHRGTEQNILIVSHGLTIRNIVHELCPQYKIENMLDNGSITILRYEDGAFQVKEYNKVF